MHPPSPAVEALSLGKVYGRTVGLDGLSLAVPRGQVFGLLGPNGAGKTTAVKLLLGLARPTSGAVRLLGEAPTAARARLRVGFLPEHFRFQSWMTARDLLDFHGRLCRMPTDRRRHRSDHVLERLGLAEWGRHRVGSFSKGMTQRLGLAQALLCEPELVFLDEPTSALDPLGRLEVRDIIRDLRAAGVTVFLNSHLLGEVEATCDRVAIMKAGRVVTEGSLTDLVGPTIELEIRARDLSDSAVGGLARWGRVRRAPDGAPQGPTGETATVLLALDGEDAVGAVTRHLVESGADVRSITPRRTSLEEIFVRIVGRS